MNDLRKYIDIVKEERPQQLDERGGVFDKALSKLQDLPGALGGDIGTAAAAKVDEKGIYKVIRKQWIKTATHQKVDKKDPGAFKAFLQSQLGIPDAEIQKMDGLRGPNVDIKKALMSVSAKLADTGMATTSKGKGKSKATGPEIKGTRVGGDVDSRVLRQFKQFDGNLNKVTSEGIKINRKANLLRDLQRKPGNELELMGYYVLKDAGYLE